MKLSSALPALAAGAVALASPLPSAAQAEPEWNSPAVLELVERARALRQTAAVDSSFRSYQADARGYVYFFVDRPDTGERTLVKADQIALDVYWEAPNTTKQVIVGQRDQKLLPTDIRYHLDHLTVVQDDFGDLIGMGDGDEVEAVPHPVAPSAESRYDYLLADSLTISFAGGAEEVRVYEVRVRPRDFSRPGFVGAIYLDRATAAIVRMSFSFTPASYVDPYLDYIRISLDNSLWEGRHWLPYRQEVEIRREIPVLDFMAGSVIRGRYDIRGYEFNVDIPPAVFAGGRVSTLSPATRAAFPFERGLFDELEEEGLAPSPSLAEVETQVRQMVEDQVMSGLAPLRFYFGAVSDAARYNRAEGLRIGAGLTLRPAGPLELRVSGGYAFGRERPSGEVTGTRPVGPLTPVLEAYWDRLGDIGGHAGASTLENTISAVAGEEDYTDPYFRRGARLTLRGSDPAGFAVSLALEEHVGARDVVSEDPSDTGFRPVLSIDEGTLASVAVRAPLSLPAGGRASLTGTLGTLEREEFGALDLEALWEQADPERPWHGELALDAGALTSRAPVQSLYLLGGRWTLPGHDYRSFAGDRYWLLRGEVTVPVWRPYLGVRAIGAAGATWLSDRPLPADWSVADSDGVRGSVGAGLSFGWDALRVDLAHGVGGGGWEALFSVARRFRAWL
ncbi:MAG TPA: hypothetical protein VFQ22_02535 [Longimicrobiales bacterium]|nr:hypothetical protein [Longimicrobiales bacterium]